MEQKDRATSRAQSAVDGRRKPARAAAAARVRQTLVAGLSVALTGLTVAGAAGPATAADTEHDFTITKHDLDFILKQIQVSESHAQGGKLLCDDRADSSWTCVPDPRLPYGLRTVDGTDNNLMPKRAHYGASGKVFPRLLPAEFKDAEKLPFDPDGPNGPLQAGVDTSYKQNSGYVADSQPRVISNLIVDQTRKNPAAALAAQNTPGGQVGDNGEIFIPNRSPDEGLSAPFNSWFTMFGQFFDHGLDLVSKGGSGTVAVPLQPGDPLYDDTPGARTNFIFLTRATNQPGPDGKMGTADDVKEHVNRTTPYVDQNQTYTSHPSHQVFLREYEKTPEGPVPTGRMLNGAGGEGLATWADIKRQASEVLGITLVDGDVNSVPLVATDAYGRFLPGPSGYPQLVMAGTPNTFVEGNPASPVAAEPAMDSGHAFLDDIAHNATPTQTPDEDQVSNDVLEPRPQGTYDDELLNAHFITGDGRGNENIGLTAVHQVFHSEHNRVVADIDRLIGEQDEAFQAKWQSEEGPWDYGERLFQAGRFVTEMEYQHLVFEEFARKIQPTIDVGPLNESLYHADINPAVTAEFAHVVYRFGHSMLTDTVARKGFGTEDLPLLDAFLNPQAYTDNGRLNHEQASAAVIQGMMNQTGNGIDEFVVDTLRNHLLGLPLDLATINLARGRDAGVPSLQTARKVFYEASFDSALKPYDSWEDFRLSMKHRESITNFVAAYGIHPTLTEATTLDEKRAAAVALVADEAFMNAPAAETGLNDVDFWVGGLAEQMNDFGGMLGSTFNAVFEEHMENLQNADRFYYLNRLQGLNLFSQMEANSFSEIVMRNTEAKNLPADGFASQDLTVDLDELPDPLPAGLVNRNGQWRYDGPEHITVHGTDNADDIRGGEGDDALWTHGGDDRAEGGIGDDQLHGGPGNDILTDLFGDDIIHGGPGDDAINAGAGLDLIFGQSGKDFMLHGQEVTQSFAGLGTDFVLGGNAGDVLTGNEDEDWLEGGGGADLVQGDNALTFQNDPEGGSDILDGGRGNDDHDAEGGNDVMLNNGRDRHHGMLGWDWVTHKGDPDPVDADMDVTIFQPPNVTIMRPLFAAVEGLSGWDGDDILRGSNGPTDPAFADTKGHVMTQAHLDEIAGLRTLMGGGAENPRVPKYATQFLRLNQSNNVILGGSGSDIIEGRGGDDFIDGDAALNVYLEAPGGERADSMAGLRARVFDGKLDPADITIHREIVTEKDDSIDTVQYEDVRANHTITDNKDGTWRVAHVEEDAGGLSSGVDILQNVERLRFADEVVDLAEVDNTAASGRIEFSTLAPKEDQEISVVTDPRTFSDPDGIQEDTITYTWQWADDEGEWTSSVNGTGTTFVPGDAEAGMALRVIVTFLDNTGTQETITSHSTLPVENVNDAPTGLVVDNNRPKVGDTVRATGLVDLDGTHNDDGDLIVKMSHQWQRGSGSSFQNIAGATGESYTATEADRGSQLRVRVRYTDVHGTAEEAFSPPTQDVYVVELPGAPAVGAATPGRNSATLTWSPGFDGNSQILGYVVEIRSGGQTVRTLTGLSPESTTAVVDGLTGGTAYEFRVRAINELGAGAWSQYSASFAPQVDRPTVVARTPAPQATGVSVTAPVTVRFDRPVTGVNSTSVRLVRVSNGAAVPATVTYNAGNRTATLQPNAVLTGNEQFEVRLSTGIRDTAGTSLTPEQWSFRTAVSAPSVVARTPAVNATGVATNTAVTVRFDRPITGASTSTVRLFRVNTGTYLSRTVSYNAATRTVTMRPSSALPAGERIEVQLTNGIQDQGGNRLTATQWRFTTAQPAPRIVAQTPAPGATGVSRTGALTVRFDKAVTGVSTSSVQLIRVRTGATVGRAVSYSSTTRTVTVRPTATLQANETFEVRVTNAIRDTSGVQLAPSSWRFTTRR